MVAETFIVKLVESTARDKLGLTPKMPGFRSNSKLPVVKFRMDTELAEKPMSEWLDTVRNAAFQFEIFDWLVYRSVYL